MWEFHDFSITQILLEINFGDCKSAKFAISTNFEALTFDFFFQNFCKAEVHQMKKFRAPKIAKNGNFRTFTFSKIDFT